MIGDYNRVNIYCWVEISRGCDYQYSVDKANGVTFTVVGKPEPFQIFFETEALQLFMERGNAALAELDTPNTESLDH